ncbi:MAG: glycosyltransferase family 4 protein, partial [Methylococcaceae bacterium]|nr:glycosyltransferase family 4 protein [Methylococcaceae bacterium]
TVDIDEQWAIRINNRYFDLPLLGEVVWQPCRQHIVDADLVIVEQANRLLFNYPLKFLWRNDKRKVAFWGHGTNFQSSDPNSLDNRLKRYLAKQVDWWFAYTKASIRHLEMATFPTEKVTVVQNCIDTSCLKEAVERTSAEELDTLRQRLGLRSNRVGLYCGGLYADKQIDFLLRACDELKEKTPDFECIIIGDGPDSEKVRIAATSRNWLHYMGPIFGDERIPYFLLARVLLIPGALGLVVIDSFVSGVPLVTTNNGKHGPEIAYLENCVNGFMTANNVSDYVNEVTSILIDDNYWQDLRKGCSLSAEKYSLENMVENFATGIRRCLALNEQ